MFLQSMLRSMNKRVVLAVVQSPGEKCMPWSLGKKKLSRFLGLEKDR